MSAGDFGTDPYAPPGAAQQQQQQQPYGAPRWTVPAPMHGGQGVYGPGGVGYYLAPGSYQGGGDQGGYHAPPGGRSSAGGSVYERSLSSGSYDRSHSARSYDRSHSSGSYDRSHSGRFSAGMSLPTSAESSGRFSDGGLRYSGNAGRHSGSYRGGSKGGYAGGAQMQMPMPHSAEAQAMMQVAAQAQAIVGTHNLQQQQQQAQLARGTPPSSASAGAPRRSGGEGVPSGRSSDSRSDADAGWPCWLRHACFENPALHPC
jgi:hypothetical protein